MAARFDSFGLQDLTARPEDAFRLAGLAMAEGQRVRGYRGDYYRYRMGDAVVVVRTMEDPETGEAMLLGMDTHAASACLWQVDSGGGFNLIDGERTDGLPLEDPDLRRCDPLQRWAEQSGSRRIDENSGQVWMIPICVVNADVRTWVGGPVELNMAAFPKWVEYFTREEDYLDAQKKKPPRQNAELAEGELHEAGLWAQGEEDCGDLAWEDVLLRGVVKDAKVGETYLGMEPLTKFLSVTVSTQFGDLELCHPLDMVAEGQKDNVKPGAIVSALCVLSGDAAAGEYADGILFGEERALELLQYFFRQGCARRLGPALRSDCGCTFLQNRQEGRENALALLEMVGEQLYEAGLWCCMPGTVTAVEEGEAPLPGGPGKRCLLLGDGQPGDRFAFLCLVETDSLGRVREIVITNDGRYDCESDFHNTGEDILHTRERPRHGFEVLLYWAAEEKGLIADPRELEALEQLPQFRRRAEEALAAMGGELEARLERLYRDPSGDEALSQAVHDRFLELFCAAGGRREESWELYGAYQCAPQDLFRGYGSYCGQLLDQLVLVQCLGLLSGKRENQ